MEVVEDFQSRPHKAVSFVVERDMEVQEWNEQKTPKALPGYSGGRLPRRNTLENDETRRSIRSPHIKAHITDNRLNGNSTCRKSPHEFAEFS